MPRILLVFILVAVVGVSCRHGGAKQVGTTSAGKTPMGTADSAYFAAVRDFASMFAGRGTDSAKPLILEDSTVSATFEYMAKRVNDSAIFTPRELADIRAWGKRPPPYRVWTADLFKAAPNVRLIRKDTINAIFKRSLGLGWDYFYKHIGEDYYSVACPLFLRNYTFCILCCDHACGGLCGSGEILLFKKDGARWVYVKSWETWVS